MGHQERWAAFDGDNFEVTIGNNNEDEEKLSFSDLPVITGVKTKEGHDPHSSTPAAADNFEFGGLLMNPAEDMMCAADDVFFNGQILPLRPSVSSNCVLRSDSMDDRSSAAASRFSSRSGSTNSSSSNGGFISRSHSTSSGDVARKSVSNNFYAHPSPTPQVRHGGAAAGGRRRSTGSPPPGWGLFRLGVVKVPENIELSELRSRRKPTVEAKKSAMPPRSSSRDVKKEMRVIRFMGAGLACRCSPDAVKTAGPAAEAALQARKKVEEPRLKRGEGTCHRRRIFEWLEELSITKA